ncbi:MAG: radical SAM protein [Magnetospirillum sp.]|nr:radical SAM protein [Magnetospirillum sp.]
MSMTPPWYEVDLRERLRRDGSGWAAELPEFAWLAGPGSPLLVLDDGQPVPEYRHEGSRLWFRSRNDGDLPALGQTVTASLPSHASAIPGQTYLLLGELDGVFTQHGWIWTITPAALRQIHRMPWTVEDSPLVLLEDGSPLALVRHDTGELERRPGWYHGKDGRLFFRTRDDSDPNRNGRRYSLAVNTLEGWTLPVLQWPAWGQFRRLPDGQELPAYASLGLTNKCNLRCGICGSQHHLDQMKLPRSFTDIGEIRAIAATTFPFLREVELNSYGEPVLHPDFPEILDLIHHHHCLIKLQTNATLLRPAIIDRLVRQSGFIVLSIDAIGPLFEIVRKPGKWADVEDGVTALLRRRDPARLRIALYPTVTRRTLPAMLEILEWAHGLGIEFVHYHLYEPIENGEEEEPTAHDLAAQETRLRQWLRDHPDAPDVQIGMTWLKLDVMNAVPDVYKKSSPRPHPSHPLPKADPAAHADHLCQAPWQQLDFGLNGEVHVCCRSQTSPLGRADSIEAFCATWFGQTMQDLRQSLLRRTSTANVLPECAVCVESFTGQPPRTTIALPKGSITLRRPFLADGGHCVLVNLPGQSPPWGDTCESPDWSRWTLYEDERPLGPAHSQHVEIRSDGGGRYSHWQTKVYFSSSDNSSPNTNRRLYSLCPPKAKGVVARLLRWWQRRTG